MARQFDRINRYSGMCFYCGGVVEVGKGARRYRAEDDGYDVAHEGCGGWKRSHLRSISTHTKRDPRVLR